MAQSKGFKVQEGRTRLTAPDGTVFIHPHFGPNTYAQVMGEIDSAGLIRPIFRDTVSLAHTAWQNPDEKYSQEIIKLMKDAWLVADTGILYIPEKGVYVQDHPKTDKNGWPVMDEKTLASKLKAKDNSVRFTDYNYKTGEQTPKQLAKNSFIKALAGSKKQADLLAKIAGKYSDKPYLYAFDKSDIDEPTLRVASLGSDYYGYRLDVGGDVLDDDGDGCAFGVEQSGKATRKK